MMNTEGRISQFQLFFIILITQFGIGAISLPYDVFQVSKSDAWLSVLIAGFFVQINIVLIWMLHRRFPTLTIFGILNEVVGKHIAFLFKMAYILFFLTIATLSILLFGQLVNIWILPQTPIWFLILIMLSVSVFCAIENLKVIARFFVVISVLLIVFLLLITTVVEDLNYLSILPLGQNGLLTIIKGATKAIVSFLGYELLLVVFPNTLGNTTGKLKAALLANGIVTIFYAYLTFVSLTYLGPYVMEFIPEPILYIMKYQSFQIIERTDLVFFSIWAVKVGASIIMYLYAASNGLANMVTGINRSTFVLVLAVFIFILAIFIPFIDHVIQFIIHYATLASYFFIFVLPCILLFISIIRGKKEASGGL